MQRREYPDGFRDEAESGLSDEAARAESFGRTAALTAGAFVFLAWTFISSAFHVLGGGWLYSWWYMNYFPLGLVARDVFDRSPSDTLAVISVSVGNGIFYGFCISLLVRAAGLAVEKWRGGKIKQPDPGPPQSPSGQPGDTIK